MNFKRLTAAVAVLMAVAVPAAASAGDNNGVKPVKKAARAATVAYFTEATAKVKGVDCHKAKKSTTKSKGKKPKASSWTCRVRAVVGADKWRVKVSVVKGTDGTWTGTVLGAKKVEKPKEPTDETPSP